MIGNIHSIETFGTVDGPGIRYVIFLQGCPMRCAYCHNPDTWEIGAGKNMNVDEIVEDVSKYKRYIEGITVSGGEPLLQIDFVIELFEKVKSIGLSTCIDTSGILFNINNVEFKNKVDKLLEFCDLVMLDIKHIDNDSHHKLTGHGNENILEFAKYLSDKNIPVWIRHVLVPGINEDELTLKRLRDFIETLNNVEKIEILPYHTMGIPKYKELGIEYLLEGVNPPTNEQIFIANKILKGEK